MSPKTWTSGGQWGGPMSNDGHLTAETETETETELKTNTEVGSSKGYPIFGG